MTRNEANSLPKKRLLILFRRRVLVGIRIALTGRVVEPALGGQLSFDVIMRSGVSDKS
jgi:hypothetical protein